MAGFQPIIYGRFWVFTEVVGRETWTAGEKGQRKRKFTWQMERTNSGILQGGRMQHNALEKETTSERDATGRFLPSHPIGINTRWRNVSGNPAGSPRARRQFEEAFYTALIGEGTAEEAAKLLWSAARDKQPWAIQTLLQRLPPQTQSLKLVHEKGDDHGIDYTKLTDEQLRQLESILESATSAAVKPTALAGREGTSESL
jgi:hypothetical protein